MKRSTYLVGILASLTVAQSVAGEPSARMEVSEIKPLLIRAIDEGSAHGVLAGSSADYVRRKFDADSPIEIVVRTVYALPQAGCSRLEVTTRQKDVLEATKRTNKELTYQLNYCRDGRLAEKR